MVVRIPIRVVVKKQEEESGLKVGKPDAQFPIISQTETEVVSGLGDTHLNFRVSILKDPAAGTISLTTVVHFNNVCGHVYFLPVRPFHEIIIRTLLRRYLKTCLP